jgi:hypothetical protein
LCQNHIGFGCVVSVVDVHGGYLANLLARKIDLTNQYKAKEGRLKPCKFSFILYLFACFVCVS